MSYQENIFLFYSVISRTGYFFLSNLFCIILLGAFILQSFFFSSQVRAVDEMNYDFQALALESRGMGEVRGVCALTSFLSIHYSAIMN